MATPLSLNINARRVAFGRSKHTCRGWHRSMISVTHTESGGITPWSSSATVSLSLNKFKKLYNVVCENFLLEEEGRARTHSRTRAHAREQRRNSTRSMGLQLERTARATKDASMECRTRPPSCMLAAEPVIPPHAHVNTHATHN